MTSNQALTKNEAVSDNSVAAVDAVQKSLNTYIEANDQQKILTEDAISELQHQMIELSAKFDIWQSNTEPMLGQAYGIAQASMNYVTIVVAIVGLVLGAAIIYVARSKKQAIDQAIQDIRDDVVKEVMNSEELLKLIKNGLMFGEESQNAEKERALRDLGQVTPSDILNAEDASEDEPTITNGADNAGNAAQDRRN